MIVTSAPADPDENRQRSHPTGHGSPQPHERPGETLLDALPELLGVVDVREGFPVWNRDLEELAQWLPTLLDVEDEQALRRNRFLDLTVVLVKTCSACSRFVKHPANVPFQMTSSTIWNPWRMGGIISPRTLIIARARSDLSARARIRKMVLRLLWYQRAGSRTVRITLESGWAAINSRQKYAPGQSTIAR